MGIGGLLGIVLNEDRILVSIAQNAEPARICSLASTSTFS